MAEQAGVVELEKKGDTITITHVFALINALRKICNVDPASGDSAKTELLLDELDEIIANGRKVLIFGQFVEEPFGLKRLGRAIAKANSGRKLPPPLEFHGGIPAHQRDGIIKTFREDSNHHVLLLNYRVGGVGLNLQAANYVYLFDRWWNPAVEDQAIKRCHRLGQEREVFISRFYCKNTIEERILAKLQDKRRLFNLVIDEGRPAESMGLSEEEVFALFNLTVRPRRPAPPK
jgi:SNF2 family DNA or RNA helicase